jgi:ABC-type multidrug transport system permease subunit
MALVPLFAMVRKDLQLFFSDRRSVLLSFVVPIAIASFMGSLFRGPSSDNEPAKINVTIVDQDHGPISAAIVAGATADRNLRVTTLDAAAAREAVRKGGATVAVIIPKGFGDAAGAAFFGNGEKPPLDMLFDPSRGAELAMVRGILTEHIMQAVSREMFGGPQGRVYLDQVLPQVEASTMDAQQKALLVQMLVSVRKFYDQPAQEPRAGTRAPGISVPYAVHEQAVTSGQNVAYNGYAHSFGGMAIQFLLFAMANLGVEMLIERQRGLWRRVRSAPVSRLTLLAGKALSGAAISLMVLGACFGFAMVVFGVRVHGSVAGFVGIAVACSLMASAFGILIAALGNTPATARGVTTLAVLLMVMLGGAWVPSFVFPGWLQQFTKLVPVRWAVDGFDAMTWRGTGLAGALAPIGALLAFAGLFSAVALLRFRWEEP